MNIGKLDRRCTILRRAVQSGANERGAFEEAFERWGQLRPFSARDQAVAGIAENQVEAELLVRDDRETRSITTADRVLVGPLNQDYAIRGVQPFERAGSGLIRLTVTTQRAG